MKEVFGCTTAGVYCCDRPEAACPHVLVPACGGPTGRTGYSGTELITDDGTIPFKVILRCLADVSGLLWRKAEERSRTIVSRQTLYLLPTFKSSDSTHTVSGGAPTKQASRTSLTNFGHRQVKEVLTGVLS